MGLSLCYITILIYKSWPLIKLCYNQTTCLLGNRLHHHKDKHSYLYSTLIFQSHFIWHHNTWRNDSTEVKLWILV